jgi:hypothetical protein
MLLMKVQLKVIEPELEAPFMGAHVLEAVGMVPSSVYNNVEPVA